MNKFKDHLARHKNAYILVGTSISVAGITYLIMRTRMPTALQSGPLAELPCSTKELPGFGAKVPPQGHTNAAKVLPQGHSISNLTNSVGINNGVVNVFEREGRGHPGYMVRCLENGLTYNSQKAAAMDLDLNEMRLSQHLNGAREQVGGLHFERINMAA